MSAQGIRIQRAMTNKTDKAKDGIVVRFDSYRSCRIPVAPPWQSRDRQPPMPGGAEEDRGEGVVRVPRFPWIAVRPC